MLVILSLHPLFFLNILFVINWNLLEIKRELLNDKWNYLDVVSATFGIIAILIIAYHILIFYNIYNIFNFIFENIIEFLF